MEILACSKCHQNFTIESDRFFCNRCSISYRLRGHVLLLESKFRPNSDISYKKWKNYYQEIHKDIAGYQEVVDEANLKIARQLKLTKKSNNIFLELGCGSFGLGRLISSNYKLVIGVDFSVKALELADRLMKKQKIKNYLLIQAEVQHLPIKNGVVNYIFGGGVIEHFTNVTESIQECFRILKNKGVVANCVPIVNIGALTYRQIWGNIPELPILKNILWYLHFKILSPKHLYFGLERSYRRGQLKRWHLNSGFKKVVIERCQVEVCLNFIPKTIRPPFIWLAENSWLFWPMGTVIATK